MDPGAELLGHPASYKDECRSGNLWAPSLQSAILTRRYMLREREQAPEPTCRLKVRAGSVLQGFLLGLCSCGLQCPSCPSWPYS